MKLSFDTHIHTQASGHVSRATVTDVAKAAAAKGLARAAITDHAPAMPGAASESYFRSLLGAPKERFGVRLACGAEVNILPEGGVDLPHELTAKLFPVIASLHPKVFRPQDRETNTRAVLGVLKHPHVDILGHLDDGTFPLDYDSIVRAAKEARVAVECNAASLSPDAYRKDAARNLREILLLCKRYAVPVAVGSDSHGTARVGDFATPLALIAELGIEDLVVNDRLEKRKI